MWAKGPGQEECPGAQGRARQASQRRRGREEEPRILGHSIPEQTPIQPAAWAREAFRECTQSPDTPSSLPLGLPPPSHVFSSACGAGSLYGAENEPPLLPLHSPVQAMPMQRHPEGGRLAEPARLLTEKLSSWPLLVPPGPQKPFYPPGPAQLRVTEPMNSQ